LIYHLDQVSFKLLGSSTKIATFVKYNNNMQCTINYEGNEMSKFDFICYRYGLLSQYQSIYLFNLFIPISY